MGIRKAYMAERWIESAAHLLSPIKPAGPTLSSADFGPTTRGFVPSSVHIFRPFLTPRGNSPAANDETEH